MGFFKNIFGKKTCALCGAECGVMSRTKIKNDEYLCNDCGDKCSKYVRLSEMTLDEIKRHMGYMERMNKLYEEKAKTESRTVYPSSVKEQAIEFFDGLGMFAIKERYNTGRGKMNELFRYDQVAEYKEYYEESRPSEPNAKPEFKECGIKIKLVGQMTDTMTMQPGLRPHPYIKHEIKICFSKKDPNEISSAHSACTHFNYILGINDNQKGLFNFGLSKKEQRDLKAAVGAAKGIGMVLKAVKDGVGEAVDEAAAKAEFEKHANAVNDGATNGLAEYSRRADAAETEFFTN